MLQGRSTTCVRLNSSKMDTDATESELVKLQGQFRSVEGGQLAYNIQALEQIRKQQQEIDKLLKEQEELHGKLGVSRSVCGQQQRSKDTASCRALVEQTDTLEAELGKEKQCQKDLQKEISNMQLKLVKLRRGKVLTSDTQRSEAQRTRKSTRTLEFELDRALTCLNEQLSKNHHLKEELEKFHDEHINFLQLHDKLDKELQELREKIGELIDLPTAAFDARAEAHCIMTIMREKERPEDKLEQNHQAEALRVQINWFREEMENFRVEGLHPEEDRCSLLRDISKQTC